MTIAKRKSMYAQMQGQLGQLQEALKDKEGTIETLERQLVQAGIKGKVMQAEVEINKKKEEVKSKMEKNESEQNIEMKDQAQTSANNALLMQSRAQDLLQNYRKDLEREKKSE